jgi:acid stress-induced BolA-like protein IbaG/YrbA
MMHPETIETLLREGMSCEFLSVEGDGHHFEALIVSAEFVGKNRVQRQQRVNAVLKGHFDSGVLHALSMKTLTPEEWTQTRGAQHG